MTPEQQRANLERQSAAQERQWAERQEALLRAQGLAPDQLPE